MQKDTFTYKDKKLTLYKIEVSEITEEAPGTYTYYFEAPKDLFWKEGSDLHVAHQGFMTSDGPDKDLIRHLSIMTLPEERKLGFTTRVPGSQSMFKELLSKVEVGDELYLFKPANKMPLRRNNRGAILISMGVGIATMRPLIKTFLKDSEGISKLVNLNVDSSGHYVYGDELNALYHDMYSNDWTFTRSGFYNRLDDYARDKDNQFYVVGSDSFIRQVIKRLRASHVRDEDIFLDKKPEKMGAYFEFSDQPVG